MNNSTRVLRRPRRAWPPAARTAAAIIATAALALLSAACSGSPSSTSSGGSSNTSGSANSKALAYARCVRSHGVPDFPDPNSAGEFNKTTMAQLSASNSQYQTATQACAHLLPNSGGVSQAVIQQAMDGMRRFAQCMRSDGVSNWGRAGSTAHVATRAATVPERRATSTVPRFSRTRNRATVERRTPTARRAATS